MPIQSDDVSNMKVQNVVANSTAITHDAQLTQLDATPNGLLLTQAWKTHFRHQMPIWTDFGSESEGAVCRNPLVCNNLREWAIQDLNL